MTLSKAGGNWVEGDQFYDRKSELAALTERAHDGIHTLLTAQRRMGKTSLVRELLRRLKQTGQFETIFVDLEAAKTPAKAIAEIGIESMAAQGAWSSYKRRVYQYLTRGCRAHRHVGSCGGPDKAA